MGHEKSRTVEREGRWLNVYGPDTHTPGVVLEPQFNFEKWSYATEPEASAAAKERSNRWREVEMRAAEAETSAPPPKTDLGELSSRLLGEARAERLRAGAAVQEAERKKAEAMVPAITEARGILAAPRPPIPPPPTLTPPPSRQLTDFLAPVEGEHPSTSILKLIQAMGLFVTGISGLARKDARASMAALTGALQGWHEGAKEKADRHFADWQAKTTAMLKQAELDRQRYQDVLADRDATLPEKLAAIRLIALENEQPVVAAKAAQGNWEWIVNQLTEERKHEDTVALLRDRMAQAHEDKNRLLDIQERLVDAKIKEMTEEAEPLDIDVGARRLIRGDAPTTIVRGIGKRATKRFEQIQRRAEEILRDEQGLSEQDIATKLSQARMAMTANTAALSRLTQQEAQIAPFTETARDSLRRARELSDKIQRGGVPWANRWTMRARKGLAGDADVATLDYHIRLGINEVAKITSSATGGGGVVSDTARREIEDTINAAMTPEQIRRVIEGADFEMTSRLRHIARQKEALLGLGPAIGGPPDAKEKDFTLPDGTRVKVR